MSRQFNFLPSSRTGAKRGILLQIFQPMTADLGNVAVLLLVKGYIERQNCFLLLWASVPECWKETKKSCLYISQNFHLPFYWLDGSKSRLIHPRHILAMVLLSCYIFGVSKIKVPYDMQGMTVFVESNFLRKISSSLHFRQLEWWSQIIIILFYISFSKMITQTLKIF